MILSLALVSTVQYLHAFPISMNSCKPIDRLAIRTRRHFPEEFWTREELVVVNSGKEYIVKGISSAAGFFRVSSPKAALELVRFFTLPITFTLFCETDGHLLEPMPLSEAKRHMYIHSHDWYKGISYYSGVNAIYCDEEFRKLRLPAVRVTKSGRDFKVERTLIKKTYGENAGTKLIRVLEVVTSEGHITRTIKGEAPFDGHLKIRSFEYVRSGGLVKWN